MSRMVGPNTTETSYDRTDDWRQQARCRDYDPEMWHPAGASDEYADQIEEAKSICRRCPVQEKCLDAAVIGRESGIWAATTVAERKGMARKATRARSRPPVPNPSGAGPGFIPDIGSSRRLQALARIGWTMPALASVARSNLGYREPASTLEKVLGAARGQRPIHTTLDVKVLTSCLYSVLRVMHSDAEHAASTVAMAENCGWPAPSAWHGLDMDDPAAEPRQRAA
jgi:WhiB family redox-sensing transcriptional regulator